MLFRSERDHGIIAVVGIDGGVEFTRIGPVIDLIGLGRAAFDELHDAGGVLADDAQAFMGSQGGIFEDHDVVPDFWFGVHGVDEGSEGLDVFVALLLIRGGARTAIGMVIPGALDDVEAPEGLGLLADRARLLIRRRTRPARIYVGFGVFHGVVKWWR